MMTDHDASSGLAGIAVFKQKDLLAKVTLEPI